MFHPYRGTITQTRFPTRPVPLLKGLAVRIATPSVAAWECGESSSFSVNPDRHVNNSHY